MDFAVELQETLAGAQHLVVFTGSGVSAESGVPTFRGAQTGLWARFRPEDLATPEAFLADPELVWDWYAWRRQLVQGVEPNPAHRAIAERQDRVPRLTLITQNVDGLHQRAGSRNVVELHGNIHRAKCFENHHPASERDDRSERPPRCTLCGSLLRPDVVWFNEELPARPWAEALDAAVSGDVFIAIGTSMLVQPAAWLPISALEAGAQVIQINPEPTDLSNRAPFDLRGRAGDILPALIRSVWRRGT